MLSACLGHVDDFWRVRLSWDFCSIDDACFWSGMLTWNGSGPIWWRIIQHRWNTFQIIWMLMLSRHYSFLFFQSTYVWRHSVSYILKSGSRLHQIKLNNIVVFRYIILPQTIQFVILIMKQLSHSLSCWCLSSSIAPQRMCCNWQRRERWLWQREHAFSDFLTVISAFKTELHFGAKALIPFGRVHKFRVAFAVDGAAPGCTFWWHQTLWLGGRGVHDHKYWSACPKPWESCEFVNWVMFPLERHPIVSKTAQDLLHGPEILCLQ